MKVSEVLSLPRISSLHGNGRIVYEFLLCVLTYHKSKALSTLYEFHPFEEWLSSSKLKYRAEEIAKHGSIVYIILFDTTPFAIYHRYDIGNTYYVVNEVLLNEFLCSSLTVLECMLKRY